MLSMVKGIIKLPLRLVRKIVRTVTGGSEPAPAPAPAPAPRPKPPEQPPWMRQDRDMGHEHSHDHGHSHDHSHSHDHGAPEPEPAPAAAPAPAPAPVAGGVDVYPEDTPNPNAYKFTVSTKVAPKAFSASKAEEAETPLASELIGLDGVTSIFGVNDFITITKAESASWDSLIPAVTAVIQKHVKG